ncbi:hypothetical protein C0992_013258, partial [Termitomyces sp. T32_za158]
LVQLGIQILKIIPGRVSISTRPASPPRQTRHHRKGASMSSYGIPPLTHTQVQTLVALFAAHGYARTRVLINVLATYAGILACRTLVACNPPIHTNATLIFGLVQARASQLYPVHWAS